MPSTIMAPCVRFMTFMTPQIRVSPMAARPYTAPTSSPSMMEAMMPIIGEQRPCEMEDWEQSSIFVLSLVDDLRRAGRLGPDHFLVQSAALLLPFCDDHLVAHLQAVPLGVSREFGAAEHRGDIHAVEHSGYFGLLGRPCLLDGALQD